MPPPAEDLPASLAKKLHHFRKLARKAAKKARTFETQKAVKKLKTLKKDEQAANANKAVEVLEKELKIIKALSPDQLGDRALRGRLAAHEALSSSEILNSALEIEGIEVGEDLVGEEGQLAKRVLANGAFVREVQRIVGEIEATVDVLSGNRKKKKKAPQKKEAKSKKVVRKGPDEGVKDDEEASDAESWNSRDFDDANMVASDSSASGSGDEDGIQFDGELEAGSDAEMSDVYSSSYGSDAGDSESEVDEREIAGRNKGGRGKSRGKDFQDLEKPRNRMGQRARRLLWEKEYGKKAKHLQNAAAERGRGRGGSRGGSRGGMSLGASRGGSRGGAHSDRPAFPAKRRSDTQEAFAPPAKKAKVESAGGSGGLHGSWEAKKRERERIKEMLQGGGGKKVVFGDDDD